MDVIWAPNQANPPDWEPAPPDAIPLLQRLEKRVSRTITPTRARSTSRCAPTSAAENSGIHRSMGSKGDCFNNAVLESFFKTLEKDLLRRGSFATRQDARTAVFDYIEAFHNPIRLHSTLGYRSPIEYMKIQNDPKAA